MSSRPVIAVSLGDPAGIGPEVILKALARGEVGDAAAPVVFGSVAVLRRAAGVIGAAADWPVAELPAAEKMADSGFRRGLRGAIERARGRGVPLLVDMPGPGGAAEAPVVPGTWTPRTGRDSLAWVEAAVAAAFPAPGDAEPLAAGIVTAPICKAAWHAAGAVWPGHTELLAELAARYSGRRRREVMLLAGGGLRVALATTHTPLRRVPELLATEHIVQVGRVVDAGLRGDFGLPSPRLAVLGLNPHAGESGGLGTEEAEIIEPAIAELRSLGVDATGPHAADTAFHFAQAGRYDAVLAMYHDQGLAPLKTVAFDSGVNITLGLPLVRVSPDHGTAFDLAGLGRASETSMTRALLTAAAIIGNRRKRSAMGVMRNELSISGSEEDS